MDDDIKLEKLYGFVSHEIFQFLTSTDNMDSELTSDTDGPSTSHASIDLLDAHIDALLWASSQLFEEMLEPDTKHQRLDTSLQTATKKRIFTVPKTKEEVAEAKLGAIPAKILADNSYCIGV